MKRSTVFTALFIVGILVSLMIFEAYAASPPENPSNGISINLQNEIGNLPKTIRSGDLADLATCVNVIKIAPVFDATGSVVSDPSGTLLIHYESGVAAVIGTCPSGKIAPVFGASGAIVSDPTGTISNASQIRDPAARPTSLVVKIAPVFDVTGAVVSDPTGTILSGINP